MKKNILSFNKCKHDTMWPINRCMSRENIYTLLSIISQKKISPILKIGKTKQVLGKTVLGNNKGGGDKYKDTNQVFKKLSYGYTWRKIFSLSINANMTLCDP